MTELLEINLNELSEFGDQLTGEIHPDIFELKDDEGKAVTGLNYDLNVQRFDTELLLQGRVYAEFELECVRTLHPFKKTIEVSDFSVSLEIVEEVVNPTEQLREEIMILFPTYPVCDMADEKMSCQVEEKYLALDKDQKTDLEEQPQNTPDDRWSTLDQLENL